VSVACASRPQFVIALGQIVVAMAVATWYFTRDKSTITSFTVFSSIRKATFYHSGTAAFGPSRGLSSGPVPTTSLAPPSAAAYACSAVTSHAKA
jgi:hypothetical protein